MARRLSNVYDLRPNIEQEPFRKRARFPEIVEEDFWQAFELAKPYSMLAITGFYNIYQSLRYIAVNDIPGDFVECGALFGGSSIFMADVARQLGMGDRAVHVFDTFEGFPEGSEDKRRGKVARGPRYRNFFRAVEVNFEQTCGTDNVEFHVGPVEETLDGFVSGPLALLRLDTDFYSSTQIELEVLYPALSPGGVLIVDDYGHYEGSRRATDEFLDRLRVTPLLIRVDRGVWAGTKPNAPVDS
jgi:O-methyltransferase